MFVCVTNGISFPYESKFVAITFTKTTFRSVKEIKEENKVTLKSVNFFSSLFLSVIVLKN